LFRRIETFVQISILRNEAKAPRVSETVPGTHAGLDDLIAATLDLDRTVRPASARQLQEQLLAFLPELSNAVRPIAKPPASGQAQLPRVSASNAAASTQPSISLDATDPGPPPPTPPSPGTKPSAGVADLERSDTLPLETPKVRIVPALAERDPHPITGSEKTLASPNEEPGMPKTRARPKPASRTFASQVVLAICVMLVAAAITALFMRG